MTSKNEEFPIEVKTDVTVADFSLFIELEYTVAQAREQIFNKVNEIMERYKKTITVPEFSRYCLYASARFYVPTLIRVFGLPADQAKSITQEIDNATTAYMTAGKLNVLASMKETVEETLRRGMKVCALSAMTFDQTNKALNDMGLGKKGIDLFCCADDIDEHFPRADTWMKMARELGRSSRRTVVFSSSSRACKSTLSAGMRAVAVTDQFTAFQDFGGAELVLEDGKWDVAETLDFLYPIH